jgi:hypothetical protein
MEMDNNILKMEINTSVNIKMENPLEREFTIGKMVKHIKVNL